MPEVAVVLMPDLDSQRQKAFDAAQAVTTQLLTLATGVIAVTLTFSKDFLGGAKGAPKVLLAIAWLLFLASILYGILTLMGLTGELEKMDPADQSLPSIRTDNVTDPSKKQGALFFLAVLLTVIAGALALLQ